MVASHSALHTAMLGVHGTVLMTVAPPAAAFPARTAFQLASVGVPVGMLDAGHGSVHMGVPAATYRVLVAGAGAGGTSAPSASLSTHVLVEASNTVLAHRAVMSHAVLQLATFMVGPVRVASVPAAKSLPP